MEYDDWAILRHLQILLFLASEAIRQLYLCLQCGLGSPNCPGQGGEDKTDREHLDSLGRTKCSLFKSLRLPVRLNLSVLAHHSDVEGLVLRSVEGLVLRPVEGLVLRPVECLETC